jgi:hypothetical protein
MTRIWVKISSPVYQIGVFPGLEPVFGIIVGAESAYEVPDGDHQHNHQKQTAK